MLSLAATMLACERGPAPAPAGSASAASAEALAAEFAALTPAAREQAARQPCYTRPTCPTARTRALLQSAPEAERKALTATLVKALAAEVQSELSKRHGTVVRVSVSAGRVLIAGVCSKVVLENFLATAGPHAKQAGITHVECASQALSASAELP